jgi:adenylosuccinate lyase
MDNLMSISPVDGRYADKTAPLQAYFSEFALFKYRVKVEVLYFNRLIKLLKPTLLHHNSQDEKLLMSLFEAFSLQDAMEIKKIEKTTNHDVKAVEYFLKEKLKHTLFDPYLEWIHFGLTSQDINNTAIPMSLKDALQDIIFPALHGLIENMAVMARSYAPYPMLARTHGQPASPTSMGKEWAVFVQRLTKQLRTIEQLPIEGKFGGATGNFNAHVIAWPDINWREFADSFCREDLGIERQSLTTQIEHYDQLAALLQSTMRINTILIDFCRDIWTYVSLDYFKQKTLPGEVGSSAMPHKVNPIDFENAEGNLGISNALADHMAMKLPISRLQRDLTDSTVLRNLGLPLAYQLIAIQSIEKGIKKLEINPDKLNVDLMSNYAVLAEAIQSVLRSIGYPAPYEALKALTRGKDGIDSSAILAFIESLDIDPELKKKLSSLTPADYIGYADQISEDYG